ncbi:hypothetical protein GCM10010306_024600 [Streptomyces umbrinus]|uniref:hypothetical protein n=1 Tax=Streptomyces umbrinus TaxID=67370 RepID=UPI0016767EC1|nr:hypothetical protein [Streptomyces umbrinus]GHB30853.1 hypothetical protein GCM10010306_024600 [Streptomyces umbrinus]
MAGVTEDLDGHRPGVVEAALRADAVLYSRQAGPEQETGTVQDLTRALAGTVKALVFLSGSGRKIVPLKGIKARTH